MASTKKESNYFQEQSAEQAINTKQQTQLGKNLGHFFTKHEQAKKQFSDIEMARKRAAAIKNKTLDHLDEYLLEFEKKFTANAGQIIWADSISDALTSIQEILSSRGITTVVKSKSMVTEEIGLNAFLKEKNIEHWESDLGELIQQLSNEPPFHLVTPAIHKSEEQIIELFRKFSGIQTLRSAQEVTMVAKNFLRQKFKSAGAFISGVNFMLADIGAIAITENEGNVLMGANGSKLHIAITGIEKILPSVNDLELFWPLLASYGTGQKITSYNSIFSGPSENEKQELILILINNGRTDVLSQLKQRKILGCIRCGSCLNICPVYKTIGGHAYGSVYNGPIGKALNPWMNKLEKYNHQAFASSICGACTDACPVNIDIHKVILQNRQDIQTKASETKTEKISWYFWKEAMLSRRRMNRGGSKAKNFLMKTFFKSSWGEKRNLPVLPEKSFNELFREKMGLK